MFFSLGKNRKYIGRGVKDQYISGFFFWRIPLAGWNEPYHTFKIFFLDQNMFKPQNLLNRNEFKTHFPFLGAKAPIGLANVKVTCLCQLLTPKSFESCNIPYLLHVCKFANMQICKYANIQVCKYASMQVCKYVSMQVCKYASMQVCKYVNMQVSKYASMHECKYASMQECEYEIMQVWK